LRDKRIREKKDQSSQNHLPCQEVLSLLRSLFGGYSCALKSCQFVINLDCLLDEGHGPEYLHPILYSNRTGEGAPTVQKIFFCPGSDDLCNVEI
jgi:hypothetical protein